MKKKFFILTLIGLIFSSCEKENISSEPFSSNQVESSSTSESKFSYSKLHKEDENSFYDYLKPVNWDNSEEFNVGEDNFIFIPLEYNSNFMVYKSGKVLRNVALIVLQKNDGTVIEYIISSKYQFANPKKVIKKFINNKRIFVISEKEINSKYENGKEQASLYKYVSKVCYEIVEVFDDGSVRHTGIIYCETSDSSNSGTGDGDGSSSGGGGSSTTNPDGSTTSDCDTTKEMVRDLYPNADPVLLDLIVETVNDVGAAFGIDTQAEVQHFLAQAGYETGGFQNTTTTEDLHNYSAQRLTEVWGNRFAFNDPNKLNPYDYEYNAEALANAVYANRMGNGNIASGDGWKYRGRGIFQLTGKSKYVKYEEFLESVDLGWSYDGPDTIMSGTHAVLSAMWFFKNEVLDNLTITATTSADEVTNIVNKYTDSYSQRRNLLAKAKNTINCL